MFGYNLNVRPPAPPQQHCFSPPPRYQGRGLQPWPEMGGFGVHTSHMNQPRPNMPRAPNEGGYHGGFRPNGPWGGGPMCNRPPQGQFRPPVHGRPPFPHQNQGQNSPRTFHRQQNHGGNFQKKQQKKQKKEMVDPGSMNFYCEMCDRGFKTEETYKEHCAKHEKCPKEGCQYEAAGKLVQIHIKMQHKTGYAKRIWSMQSAEDIKKWREERKKNFPTKENIEKKAAVMAERRARGEVVEEKYFGKMRGQGRRGRGRGRGRWGNNRQEGWKEQGEKRKLEEPDSTDCTAAKKQTLEEDKEAAKITRQESLGVFFDAAGNDDSSSDSDGDDNSTPTIPSAKGDNPASTSTTVTPELSAAGALGSLMSMYSASGDESDGEEAEAPKETSAKDKPTDSTDKLPDSKTSPDKSKDSNSDKPNHQDRQQNNPRHRNRNRGRARNNNRYDLPKLDKTMLEKLLAKEIRQERNKIMQCVHYIVKQNFFDK